MHTNTFCKYRKKLLASPRVHLVSSFFLFSKKLPIVVVRDVCPSVRPSVCPSVRPSVEIISFRGNSLSIRPIDLKIGLNVREGVVHVRKAWFFEIRIASCNFLQFMLFYFVFIQDLQWPAKM